MINADPAAYPPRDAQEETKHAEYRIDAHRSRQDVVHVHQDPEAGGDPRQDAQEQAHADRDFSPGHQEREEPDVWEHDML